MKKQRPGEKVQLMTVDELLGVPDEEATTEIKIDEIDGFNGHPFKVLDDDKMDDLCFQKYPFILETVRRAFYRYDFRMVQQPIQYRVCKHRRPEYLPPF